MIGDAAYGTPTCCFLGDWVCTPYLTSQLRLLTFNSPATLHAWATQVPHLGKGLHKQLQDLLPLKLSKEPTACLAPASLLAFHVRHIPYCVFPAVCISCKPVLCSDLVVAYSRQQEH